MRLLKVLALTSLNILFVVSLHAQVVLKEPYTDERSVIVVTAVKPPTGYRGDLAIYSMDDTHDDCTKPTAAAPLNQPLSLQADYDGITPFEVLLKDALAAGTNVCAMETYAWLGAPAAEDKTKAPLPVFSPVMPVVDRLAAVKRHATDYTDKYWTYLAIGGVEQSDLSSQNSQTNGFADLFVRGPSGSARYLWGQIRFLGAPNASSTTNIISTVSDASGSVSTSSLSTVGTAIDYVIGGQWDFSNKFRALQTGQYTIGAVAGIGATTPLSSQTATIAYAVPAYGTNECTQLIARLSPTYGYKNALPASTTITTTTSNTSGGVTVTSTPTTSPTYCSVNPIANSTTSTNSVTGVSTTTSTTGTQITNVAFAPQDRTNFLVKYYAGIRIVDRIAYGGEKSCKPGTVPGTDTCSRAIIDMLIGQDESITGGRLHGTVFRSNITFPIRSGVYLYGSASVRALRDKTLDPLILTPTPVTGTGAVTIPSPSVMVFPLKQSDRDFYRIGIAFDLLKLLNPGSK